MKQPFHEKSLPDKLRHLGEIVDDVYGGMAPPGDLSGMSDTLDELAQEVQDHLAAAEKLIEAQRSALQLAQPDMQFVRPNTNPRAVDARSVYVDHWHPANDAYTTYREKYPTGDKR